MRTKNLNHIFKASVLAATMAAMPAFVHAAGLGKVTVLSALGQPLRAEVELSASSEELNSLKAQIAAADAFRQAGLDFAPVVSQIRVSVDKRGGKPYLRLSTDRAVNDPFLDLLLEVSWAQGRLLREYTFLLDPAPDAIALKPATVPPAPARRESESTTSKAVPVAPPLETGAAANAKATAVGQEPPPAQTVRKGDTLAKIAGQNQYEGVSLDQMLVAIFNANQDAFAGRNMNRLKAGKILDIPDRATVESVPAPEANRVVMAQSADFNAYRRKLAAAAAAAQAPDEDAAQQTAAGKITAKVEEKLPAASESKDQLKVSRADPAKDKGVQGRAGGLEEEVVAREKALQEANARLAELEKNVRDLQKLVELKNQNLADLQKQTTAAKAPLVETKKIEPAPKPEEPKPVAAEKPTEPAAVQPIHAAAAKPAPAPAVTAPVAVALAEPVKAPAPARPAKPAAPAPAPVAEPSILTELAGNPLVLGGGAVILGLLGFLGYRRRMQASAPGTSETAPTTTAASLATNSVFGSTGGRSVDTSSSSLQTDFSQASISAIDADEGVDPVAEADVYMAYGRDAQAEEILLDALKTDPGRTAIYAKLLEIYAARKNVKQFETLAGELYARCGGTGSDWEKVAALGIKLDPLNPLYGGKADVPAPAAEDSSIPAPVVVTTAEKLKDTWTMPGELAQIAQAVEAEAAESVTSTVVLEEADLQLASVPVVNLDSLDFDLDLGSPATPAEPTKPQEAVASATPEAALDIDLGLDFSTAAAEVEQVEPEIVSSAAVSLEFDLGAGAEKEDTASQGADEPALTEEAEAAPASAMLDFNFDLDEPPVPLNPPQPVIDLSAIDLNLDTPVSEPAPVAAEDDQEVATKLELAKAYEEMGDREGARELLQEVVKEGDVEQRQKARDMLEALV